LRLIFGWRKKPFSGFENRLSLSGPGEWRASLEHRILSEICSQNEPPRGKPRGILQFKSNPSAFIPAASGGVFPRGIKKQSMHIELFGLDPLRTEKLVRIYSTSFKVRL
jgi:hypothetical protein